jgi:hypothetical protein
MTAAMSVGMSAADLAAVEGHLGADGIFTAHARTDVLRLLAEVHRLREALADTGRMPTARQVGCPRCERLLDDLDAAVRALTLLNARQRPAAAATVRRSGAGR